MYSCRGGCANLFGCVLAWATALCASICGTLR